MRRSGSIRWVACALLAALPGAGLAQGGTTLVGTLSSFASQRVLVMPVQGLRGDSGVSLAGIEATKRALDDSLTAAIAGTGIGKGWGYAADVMRSAKRNVMYSGDPSVLGAQGLARPTVKAGDPLSDLLASNLRPLLALGDARFALIPVHVVVERQGAQFRARLRLVLVDGRSAQVLWIRDVVGAPAPSLGDSQLFGSLTSRVAALIVPHE